MLTEVKNKIFHFPLNVLLFVGRLQGLIVFTCETVPVISFKRSPFLCAYSNVYTVLIVTSLHILAIKIFMGFPIYRSFSKSIMVFAYIAEQTATISRVIAVYAVHFCYRNNLRKLLTEAAHLHRSISELMNGVLLYDRTFHRCYYLKVAGTLFQSICIALLISLYKRVVTSAFHSHVVLFAVFICTHFTAMTISGLFYAGMMFILVLYQNLNRKVLKITKSLKTVQDTAMNGKTKHRLYRRLGDEIDQIGFLYERSLTFSMKFNKLFSLQLLLTIFNAFSVILIEVRLYGGRWKQEN